ADRALDQAAVALGHPGADLGWGLEHHHAAVPVAELERGEPDLVGRVADAPPQARVDVAPGRGELEVRGQLQATLLGRVRGPIREGRRRTPERANITPAIGPRSRPGGGLTQSAGKSLCHP